MIGLTMLGLGVLAVSTPQPDGRVVEIIVPLGTQQRIESGERVAIMPATLELRVGDTLRIENHDVVAQPVGPYVVTAGGSLEITYGAPGNYQGTCSLSESENYEIIVSE